MNENYLLIIFGITVAIMLLIDLGIFNKKQHTVSTKEATVWTLVWISLACLFGGFIYYEFGSEKTIEYFSAYLIEKSLSLDNIFVFVLIFSFFQIQEIHKHKILFWGIIGAVFFRAIFIFSGLWLIELTYLPEMILFGAPVKINILLTIFAFILIIAGLKSFKNEEENEKDYSNNIGIKLLKKIFPVTNDETSGNFFVKINNIRYITPMFLAMFTVEVSDIIFAVDSIPAIFAISKDPIILYTSNIFAILGLRSMYFLLSNVIQYFSRLKQGIACILTFIGVKMLIADFYHISSLFSLILIFAIILSSILISIFEKKRNNSNS
jgi:tellurite resistance protein TerC